MAISNDAGSNYLKGLVKFSEIKIFRLVFLFSNLVLAEEVDIREEVRGALRKGKRAKRGLRERRGG